MNILLHKIPSQFSNIEVFGLEIFFFLLLLLLLLLMVSSFIWVRSCTEIPKDLYHLIKKAMSIRKHLERNRKDKDSKFRLILAESKIHRLARYYKKTKKLPPVRK